MWFLYLIHRIAISHDILPRSFVEAVNLHSFSIRTGNTLTVFSSQGCAIGEPEVAGAAFVDLKLDGAGPYFLLALNVVENAAVTRLSFARSKGSFTPLEFGFEVVILIVLFGDDVAHLRAGDVDHAMLYLKYVVGIVVQTLALDQCVEAAQIRTVEQNDGRAMRWDTLR